MDTITLGDIVQIVKVGDREKHLMNKVGRVMMIVDDTRCVVSFDDGNGAALDLTQVKKVG